MRNVVILNAGRTPFGRYKGALADLTSVELGVLTVKALLARTPSITSDQVDQLIMGSVLTGGQGQNVARQIAIKAGLPVETAAFTLNEVCGSGLKAILLAKQAIQLEEAEVVIAGGTENMSQSAEMHIDGLTDAFEHIPMGLTVERLADEYAISREAQDQFALQSHQRAAAADFSNEILPTDALNTLETIRPDSNLEKLAALKPVFDEQGSITAGNASPANDGAAALLLASQDFADSHHLPYLAVLKASAEIGIAPERMGISPIKAIQALLEKEQLTLADIDRFEINEAFAASSLIVNQTLGLDSSKVNVKGGALALGHPLGATGARLATTLAYQLHDEHLHYGVASLCIGGGLGLALLLENPDA